MLVIPSGYEAIVKTFGDATDPKFEALNITSIPLPYPLIYIDDAGTRHIITKIRGHRLLADIFVECFTAIKLAKLESFCGYYGGCYNYRSIRGKTQLSTHAFGIGLDLNPATNKLGTPGDMDSRVVTIFKARGFTWGGDFMSRKDPMHFQWAKNY